MSAASCQETDFYKRIVSGAARDVDFVATARALVQLYQSDEIQLLISERHNGVPLKEVMAELAADIDEETGKFVGGGNWFKTDTGTDTHKDRHCAHALQTGQSTGHQGPEQFLSCRVRCRWLHDIASRAIEHGAIEP